MQKLSICNNQFDENQMGEKWHTVKERSERSSVLQMHTKLLCAYRSD
jgi:hypothetical protein